MKLRALDVLKNLVIATFIISPILLLFLDGEYDKSQQKFPQEFASDKYSVISTDENSVRYTFTSEGENLIGFDLGGVEQQGDCKKIYLLDESGRRYNLHLENDVWINKSEILQLRTSESLDLADEKVIIVFEKGSGFELKKSNEDYVDSTGLYILAGAEEGDLNLVPVYKSEDVLEFTGKLFERITYGYDS